MQNLRACKYLGVLGKPIRRIHAVTWAILLGALLGRCEAHGIDYNGESTQVLSLYGHNHTHTDLKWHPWNTSVLLTHCFVLSPFTCSNNWIADAGGHLVKLCGRQVAAGECVFLCLCVCPCVCLGCHIMWLPSEQYTHFVCA